MKNSKNKSTPNGKAITADRIREAVVQLLSNPDFFKIIKITPSSHVIDEVIKFIYSWTDQDVEEHYDFVKSLCENLPIDKDLSFKICMEKMVDGFYTGTEVGMLINELYLSNNN